MAGRRSDGGDRDDKGEKGRCEVFMDNRDHWRILAKKAWIDRQSISEDEVLELKSNVLKYWFLLDYDLLDAIQKGDVRWADIAMARIEYLGVVLDQDLIGKCLEGDEEALCETHRFLMNEGWWDRADNLDLSKTIWRRDKEWEVKIDKQAKDLKDYVISRKELVHPNVIKMVLQGDREGLRMAMNHIHYNSLRERRVIKNMQAVLEKDKGDAEKKLKEGVKTGKIEEQSYKNALVEKGDQKRWVRKEHRFLGQKKGGNHDRFQKNSVVFVHNLPENSNSLQIWNFMRKWGRALDCILPMRKDKLGKRFGFIKLQSIAEAENFIKGVHGKMLDGNIIRAQFANKQIKQVGIKERKDFKQSKMSSLSQGRKQEPLPCTPDEIIKKTVGAIKLEDADHKLSLEIERSLVVSTLKACSIVEVLNTIESLGYDGVLVRRLSSSKFLVTFSSSDCFSNLDQDLFGLGFLDCKSVSLEDLIPPRKAVLVCLGLPVTLWKFSNFSKILEGIGYITAISRLLDENLQFKNPMFEVETKEMSEINKVLTVQHEGRQIVVQLKEMTRVEIEDNIMEELKGTEMDEDHEEINHNICSQEGSIHDDEIEGREEEAAVPILINNDKEVNGDQTLGNDSAQEANSADNYLGAAPMHDNNKDNEKNNHLVQGDFFKSQNTLELRDTVLETQETLETQEELVVQESQVESVIQETTKDLEVLETLETREDLMGQESQVESVIQETSDELVLKDPNENSISSKCNPIWSVREAESSSIADAHNSEATSRSSSVYVARQEKEQSSSGSIKKAEDCFLKLKLGRKRGRPPKRKLRKGGQPFAPCPNGGQWTCQGRACEAEKIFESCLLMGLESKVEKGEALKRIALRLEDN
uniref:RRM domain-containing protein n=1 Tax=Daucus carota subsp. sativus TaxID=79200 RepID=A0A164TD38_DAUCS